MQVCCQDHLERAIDDFVDELEEAPDIYLLKEITFTDWTAPSTCDFCDQQPVYLVV